MVSLGADLRAVDKKGNTGGRNYLPSPSLAIASLSPHLSLSVLHHAECFIAAFAGRLRRSLLRAIGGQLRSFYVLNDPIGYSVLAAMLLPRC